LGIQRFQINAKRIFSVVGILSPKLAQVGDDFEELTK
jgi:hypothetical protein